MKEYGSSMKTVAIVGAGPGLGLSLAKTFGRHHFRVALIARSQEKLGAYVQELRALQIQAAGFVADVFNAPQLEAALTRVKETFGSVDVLEYSPRSATGAASVLDMTPEDATAQFQAYVLGPMASVKAILPDMLEKGSGALFFISGLTAVTPMPSRGSVGIATAGLRNYALSLHQALAPKGIYVGFLSIWIAITKGDPEKDPDVIAARIYEMCEQRDRAEDTFPHGMVMAPSDVAGLLRS